MHRLYEEMSDETIKTRSHDNSRKLEMAKNGLRNFSDFTSFHGFRELYYAKSIIWKILWLICLFGAFGITLHQVRGAILDYLDQSSTTIIQPMKGYDDIIYPPVKLCYTHWVYWVDFEKGYEMNFSKEEILIALSFIGPIYTVDLFNAKDARNNFTEKLKLRNMTTLTEFYKAIAKLAPIILVEDQYMGWNYSQTGGRYFNSTEIISYTLNNLENLILFCYVEDGRDIMKFLKEKKLLNHFYTNTNIFNFAFLDEKYMRVSSEVASEEYSSYMAEWVQVRTPQYATFDTDFTHLKHNYTSFFAPMVVFPDGFSSIGTQLTIDTDEYAFTIKASAHKWKNTNSNPCNVSSRSIMSDVSCYYKSCAENEFYGPLNRSAFYKLHLVKKDEPDNLYRYGVEYLDIYDTQTAADVNEKATTETVIKLKSINTTTTTITNETTITNDAATATAAETTTFAPALATFHAHSKNCSDTCLIGCERWNFEVSVSSSSIYSSAVAFSLKEQTNIKIVYPLDGDILMMTEADSQTWENFVGNVGGLLGIWTGASIVSFVQMFYLCCCTECLCCNKCPTWKRRRKPNAITVLVEKTLASPMDP